VASGQVIQEFYAAATVKRSADPLLIKDILRSLERFERETRKLTTDPICGGFKDFPEFGIPRQAQLLPHLRRGLFGQKTVSGRFPGC
jgi:hypothetical protein